MRLLLEVDSTRIAVVGYDSTWRLGSTDTGNPIADVKRIREAVRQIIEDPAEMVGSVGTTAAEACG